MVNYPIDPSQSNDIDLVPPERYSRRGKGRSIPSKFDHLTLENAAFKPIQVIDKMGKPNLPRTQFPGDFYHEMALFELFFDNELTDRLV
jgi:hypothetical protein